MTNNILGVILRWREDNVTRSIRKAHAISTTGEKALKGDALETAK